MVVVRAVFQDGKFQPLDTVNLQDGQEVQLQIVEHPTSLRAIIGDLLAHFDNDDTELDEEAIIRELDQTLSGKRPLSEIVIEERREGR